MLTMNGWVQLGDGFNVDGSPHSIFELSDACRINSTTQLLAIRIACYSDQIYDGYGCGFNVDNGCIQPDIMDSTTMTLVVAMITCNSCDNDVMFDVYNCLSSFQFYSSSNLL